MPEIIKCEACDAEKHISEVIEVGGKHYCDGYCLFVAVPGSPYVDVHGDKDKFTKVANAKVSMRMAAAALAEANA